MKLRASQIVGNDNTIYKRIMNEVMFRLKCCVPGVIQSYDPTKNVVEVQPSIRERMVSSEGQVFFTQLPLLVNVPVVFPSTSTSQITFPINKNDECIVIFSDSAIDNFWLHGSVQNPVEIRRHDLSDGIAIPCMLSQPNTPTGVSNEMTIKYLNSSIVLDGEDIKLSGSFGNTSVSEILSKIN